MASFDAIIIGAGHNGLVAAAYLAKAGKKTLVLECREAIGGIAAEEVVRGFKFPACAHLAAGFSPQVIADLDLKNHGLEILSLDPLLFAPSPDGHSLSIPRDFSLAGEEMGRHSKKDAGHYAAFCARLKALCRFLLSLYGAPLPDKGSPDGAHPIELLKVAWKFRRLGKKEGYEFLRVLPLSVADLLSEWFESELLKASLAASGILGSFVGPRQQGTAFNLLHHQIGASNGALRTAGFVRGGMGELPRALAKAARQYGAEIRTGSEVKAIVTQGGAATGVVLKDGEAIGAARILSAADVKRTFLDLLDPTDLDPRFLLEVRNIRARGTVAKVNLALDGLPEFTCADRHRGPAALGGLIHIGPSIDYLERASDDAKYGRFSARPFLEITIPTVADPSLAPPGKHVMSVWMQYAPYHLRDSNWAEQRERLGDAVVDLIEDHAPGFKNLILHRQVLTPLDLERDYGLTGGHLYHAEMALDQIFFMRPLPGWARYHTPIENLYLCGSGSHPGGGLTGLPGYYAAREILKNRPGRR
ncbi:MAG TPA: NAD(P)/FAD-dependent oxidoreductase [Candidatus Binatia bacterium]|nr:NAD(P)/FAD-dependent oxidoreductase [Candidatus Binatia bacterium]